MSMVAIFIFHVNWALWYVPHPAFIEASRLWGMICAYAWCFTFSGFSIVLLASFFAGLKGKTSFKFLGFLFVGWVCLSLLFQSESAVPAPWDVYPLLLVGIMLAQILARSKKWVWLMFVLSLAMLAIPFWTFESLQRLPLYFRQMLIGDCAQDLADWPILPWIALVTWGYSLARLVKYYPNFFKRIQIFEAICWALALLLSFSKLGTYAHVPLGPDFACDVFRKAPPDFLRVFVFLAFTVRLGLDERVNAYIQQNTFLRRAISLSEVNRHFGTFYLLQFILIYTVLVRFSQWIEQHTVAGVGVILLTWLVTELLTKSLFKIRSRWRQNA